MQNAEGRMQNTGRTGTAESSSGGVNETSRQAIMRIACSGAQFWFWAGPGCLVSTLQGIRGLLGSSAIRPIRPIRPILTWDEAGRWPATAKRCLGKV